MRWLVLILGLLLACSAGVSAQVILPDFPAGLPSGALAPPTVSVGLTTDPGVLTTALRSDARLALDQGITPVMTGVWQFTNLVGIGAVPGVALEISGDTSTASNVRLTRYDVGVPGAVFSFRRARGTAALPSGLSANDRLMLIQGVGYHSGGAFGSGTAALNFYAAEAYTSTAQGSYATLETTPLGSTSRTERFRVDAAGNLGTVTAWGTNAAKVWGCGGSTAPTTSLADTVQWWCEDVAGAGTHGLHIRDEGGNTFKIGNGQVLVPDGTVSVPSMAFASATGTGLFRSAIDGVLAYAVGGSAIIQFGAGDMRLANGIILTWSVNPVASGPNTGITRNADGIVEVNSGTAGQYRDLIVRAATYAGANGQRAKLDRFEESHPLAAAATSDTTATMPANSRTQGAVFRITTTITGCATVDAGVAGATTRFGTFSALTAGTTLTSLDNTAYAGATAIRFSCVGGGGAFTAGVIRVTPFWTQLTAPTS